MTEKLRKILGENLVTRGMILFLTVMLAAGITVVALLSGKTIRMEQEASDLSRAVILAASAADIWYEAESGVQLTEIMTEHWTFREITSEDDDPLFIDPDGFSIRFSPVENSGMGEAEITVSRNGNALCTLNVKKMN